MRVDSRPKNPTCRWSSRRRPCPWPGIAGLHVHHAARDRQARLTNWPGARALHSTACRSRALRPRQIVTRPPATPDAGPPDAQQPNAEACSLRLDRRASRCAWCHVGRRAAAASAACGRLRRALPGCATSMCWGSPCASRPTALPPAAPPSVNEGDLWGDLQAVGRGTGSLLRLLRTPPIPHPFP